MASKKEDPMKKYYELIYENMISHGLGELESKLIASINSNNKLWSMEELSNMTGYSLASISNTLKKLSRKKLIKISKQPGSKKLFIEKKSFGIKLISDKIRNTISIENKKQLITLPKIKQELKESLKQCKNFEERKKIRENIKIIENKIEENEILKEIIESIKEIFDKRGVEY